MRAFRALGPSKWASLSVSLCSKRHHQGFTLSVVLLSHARRKPAIADPGYAPGPGPIAAPESPAAQM